jgi:hypothetical protein
VGHPAAFKKVIESGRNFPPTTSRRQSVNMVHNCFALGGEKSQVKRSESMVSGALPFQADQCGSSCQDSSPPRVTGKSEEEKKRLPSTEELMGCKNADEFRDVVARRQGTCSRAVEVPLSLVTRRVRSVRTEQPESRRPKSRSPRTCQTKPSLRWRGDDDRSRIMQQILLFLWAVENLHTPRCPWVKPPTSVEFTVAPRRS